jgi:hypothetical protein
MGAARGARVDLGATDGATTLQALRIVEEAPEEQVTSTSRDAELAMLLVAEEARERGVDREVVLRAQGGAPGEQSRVGAQGNSDKGKGIALEKNQEEAERAFGWERRLSTGAWRGASDLPHHSAARLRGDGIPSSHSCTGLLRGRTTLGEHRGQRGL